MKTDKYVPCVMRCGFVLLILTLATPFADAQSGAWTTPVVLADEFGWWPSLAVDPLGGVHVVWSAGQLAQFGSEDFLMDVLAYSRKEADGWRPPIDVLSGSSTEAYTVRNGIAASPDGRLHAVYRVLTKIYYASAPIQDAWSAREWTQPRLIAGLGYYTDITADIHGRIHMVWSQQVERDSEFGNNPNCVMCSEIFYRRSEDGGTTWSAPTNVSKTEWGSDKPRIHVDEGNHVYITWDEGVDWYTGRGEVQSVALAVSRDGGVTWDNPMFFGLDQREQGGHAPRDVAFGYDGFGNLVIAYRRVLDATHATSDYQLYYQVSRNYGRTWSEPDSIPGALARTGDDTGLDNYDIARDRQGHLHLVFVGARDLEDAGAGLYHVEWDGNAWRRPEEIYYTSEYPEWPRIAVDSGDGLHVVWHERIRAELWSQGKRTIRIMYAERPGGPLPEVTLMPTFTPRPTATPIMRTPTITRTPPPPYVRTDQWYDANTKVDATATVTLLVAVLPVLLIISVVFLLRGFRAGRRG